MSEDHAFRFAVAAYNNEVMSNTWRIWSNNAEVYLAVRSLAGEFKSSLHSSGNFRHAFVSDAKAEPHIGRERDRAVSKWSRPNPQVPIATLLFQVIIPGAGLTTIPTASLPKHTTVVAPYSVGNVGYLSVQEFAATADVRPISFGTAESQVLDSWRLPTGTSICVTWHTFPLQPEQAAVLRTLPTQMSASGLAATSIYRTDPRYRSFILVENPDRVGRMLDIGFAPLQAWINSSAR